MFTGIIPCTGVIVATKNATRGRFITIKTNPKIERSVPEGGSVSVDGVCLTRLKFLRSKNLGGLTFELLDSTLKRTTLGERKVGDHVNIEPAMLVGQPIGGHFISGHVDGVGVVRKVTRERHPERSPKGVVKGSRESGSAHYIVISVPRDLYRYLVPQGSIVVNGVALTIVEVAKGTDGANEPKGSKESFVPSGSSVSSGSFGSFSVALTSYTLQHTNLGDLKVGDKVNIEVDMLAKYLEKFFTQYALRHRGRKL